MKINIIKIGFLLAGTAGFLLLAPKNAEKLRNCSLVKDLLSKQKPKIDPNKINFC